jgi:hypothetical protein
MDTRGAIAATKNFSMVVLKQYVGDLTDADLLQRPGKGCNHIAWQLGHLIVSECDLLEAVAPGAAPELPNGFREKHGKENAGSDHPADFCSKQTYLDWTDKVHAAAIRALNATHDADFDRPSPEQWRKMFPTIGNVWVLIATHQLMHAGQFVPVRRALGKPVLI